jgi:DNA-binding transcriptional LysR family regulator
MVAEVAQARAHIGLAYNPPPHEQVSWVASSRQPVVMLVHPQHPLALRGGPAELQDLQRYPLATMPASFGVGQVLQMLALVENLEVRPALTTPSLLALKRAATTRQFVTLTGEPRRAARDRRGRAGGRTAGASAVPRAACARAGQDRAASVQCRGRAAALGAAHALFASAAQA